MTGTNLKWRQVGRHIAHVYAVSEIYFCFAGVPPSIEFFAIENEVPGWTYPTHYFYRKYLIMCTLSRCSP